MILACDSAVSVRVKKIVMTSNVLSLHFAISQARSSQNLNVDSYLQYCEVDSLKPSKSESSLKTRQTTLRKIHIYCAATYKYGLSDTLNYK